MFKFIKGHETDIINIKEPETQISIAISIALCAIFYKVGFYSDINAYLELLQNIIMCFVGGFIGMTGFSLAGMTMMVSLFSRKQVELIEKNNGSGSIEQIMGSYSYLAFISGINAFVLIITSVLIACDKKQLPVIGLIIFTFVVSYLSFFDIFYAVALVYNCISLFQISKIYNEEKVQQNVEVLANNIAIDYMISILVEKLHITRDDVFDGFRNETSGLPEDIKEEIMSYFERHYPK